MQCKPKVSNITKSISNSPYLVVKYEQSNVIINIKKLAN